MENGANVEAGDNQGCTSLLIASTFGNLSVVQVYHIGNRLH